MKKILKLMCIVFVLSIMQCYGSNFEYIINPQKREAYNLIKNQNKAIKNKDFKKAMSYYDKAFVSRDGFNYDDVDSMMIKTYENFPQLKYKLKINEISFYDDVAVAKLSDKMEAKIYPEINENVKRSLAKRIRKEKMGLMEAKSDFTLYLKKGQDGFYKIISDDTLMEEMSLKYGIANKIDMKLDTPLFLKKGKEYDIALKLDVPQDEIMAMASINREEIKYPPVDYPEKFRKVPTEGPLERLVKANKEGLDEYAIANVGFSRIMVNENQTKARIEIIGLAYIMKRINMESSAMALPREAVDKDENKNEKKL